SGEGKHQHRGQCLQDGKGTKRHLGVRGIEDVPGDRGSVHAAAQHGDYVGGKNKTQGTSPEDGTHDFNLSEVSGSAKITPRLSPRSQFAAPHTLQLSISHGKNRPGVPGWIVSLLPRFGLLALDI